tara:strand:+ start:980 stop:1834 length:855 start_codon:yes stop_codon:yes gene_type:complete
MKILFVSDFSLKHNGGGAQVSNDAIIKQGERLGHKITLHNFDSPYTDFLSSYDLIISSNLEVTNNKSPDKLNLIINHENHVRLEHDSCLYLNQEVRKELFGSSKINFFLSDFHISFFKSMYGDIFPNVEIIPDPIDTDVFKIEKQKKEYDIVYCGFLHKLKGVDNLITFAQSNPKRVVDVFGWSSSDTESLFSSCENIKYHGKISHLQTADVYKKSNTIFHDPIVNEPFCRMVAEAILCGVEKFQGNDSKIGSLQEYKRLGREKFSLNCANATTMFWDKIKEKI